MKKNVTIIMPEQLQLEVLDFRILEDKDPTLSMPLCNKNIFFNLFFQVINHLTLVVSENSLDYETIDTYTVNVRKL